MTQAQCVLESVCWAHLRAKGQGIHTMDTAWSPHARRPGPGIRPPLFHPVNPRPAPDLPFPAPRLSSLPLPPGGLLPGGGPPPGVAPSAPSAVPGQLLPVNEEGNTILRITWYCGILCSLKISTKQTLLQSSPLLRSPSRTALGASWSPRPPSAFRQGLFCSSQDCVSPWVFANGDLGAWGLGLTEPVSKSQGK